MRLTLVMAVAASALGIVACTDCSSDTPSAPGDAGADVAAPRRDAGPVDAGGPDTSWWDGGEVSDWPGWRRLTEVDPNCVLDVPKDVAASVQPLTWEPCTNGNPKCVQIVATGWPKQVGIFPYAQISPNGDRLLLARALSTAQNNNEFEWDVYATNDFHPVAAWRQIYGALLCDIEPSLAPTLIGTIYKTNPGPKTQVATPQVLMSGPVLTSYAPTVPNGVTFQQYAFSDTTLAFDLEPIGQVVRATVGSSSWVATTGLVHLNTPQVYGDDVFAPNYHGSGGWSQVVRVNADGTTTPFLAEPQKHVSGAESDGKTWFWSESYGSGDPSVDPQPTTEIWSAPYTNDPTVIQSTKKKLATMPPGSAEAVRTAAVNGHYAFGVSYDGIYVLRGADGALQLVKPSGGRRCWHVVYGSPTELWCIEEVINGPSGVAFTRTKLDPWP